MNRVTNPLLMIMPEAALWPLLTLMMMAGGLLMVVGARRAGIVLFVTAIAIPIITLFVELLLDSVFSAMPDSLVQPVAWLITAICYGMTAMALITLLFGQRAVDDAKGRLLADAVKGAFRLMFRWQIMLVWGGVLLYLVLTAQ